VGQAQAGDRPALEALLRLQHPRLHAICRRLLGNPADADDAAQEALLAIVRGLDRFDRRSRFSTWAYRVTVNTCLDELRRRQRRPDPMADPAAGGGTVLNARLLADPDDVAGRLDLDAALLSLSPDFRAAVVLRDLCQLDYDEIGVVLAIPPGTVRSRIARGRAALAAQLGNLPPAAERPTDQS
jgi:RNA polymerase sigma-70 factor (ECF subfamily)